jgi:hypothetical protein
MAAKAALIAKTSENFSRRSFLSVISTSPVESNWRKMSTTSSSFFKTSEYDFEINEIYDHVDALPDMKKLAKTRRQSKNGGGATSNTPLALSNIYSVESSVNRLNRIMKQKAKAEKSGAREMRLVSNGEAGGDVEEDCLDNDFYIKMATPKTFYYFPSKKQQQQQLPMLKSNGINQLDSLSNHHRYRHLKATTATDDNIKENLLKETTPRIISTDNSTSRSVKHLFFPQLSERSAAKKKDRLALKSCLMERPNGSYFLQSCSYLNMKS